MERAGSAWARRRASPGPIKRGQPQAGTLNCQPRPPSRHQRHVVLSFEGSLWREGGGLWEGGGEGKGRRSREQCGMDRGGKGKEGGEGQLARAEHPELEGERTTYAFSSSTQRRDQGPQLGTCPSTHCPGGANRVQTVVILPVQCLEPPPTPTTYNWPLVCLGVGWSDLPQETQKAPPTHLQHPATLDSLTLHVYTTRHHTGRDSRRQNPLSHLYPHPQAVPYPRVKTCT